MIFILLVYGVLCSILCCFSIRRWWRKRIVEAALQRSGRRVIGRVVGQSFSMLSWDIIYSYRYQGQDYQNTRCVLAWDLYPKQEDVTVLFLDDNPQIALAQIHHSPGESTIAGLCALLYLTMAMISFFLLLRFYLL
jgi:hypothetical protein